MSVKVKGNLSVMSLVDILQWIVAARKTGRLDVERKNARRSIYFRDGRVSACSSDDPSILIGQFLLFHGRISEDTLREALSRQELTGRQLGEILVEMGALRNDQLIQVVASKAMETIHGLFDWTDAGFEFVPDAPPAPGTVEVDLPIEEILLEGACRIDQMTEIRKVFPSSDIVLEHAEQQPEEHVLASPMARRIYEAIDGRKTLEEIVLACHASEFMACEFLLQLYESRSISIKGFRGGSAEAEDKDLSLDSAKKLMDRGDYYEAIEILQLLFDANPNAQPIKTMLANAEARFTVSMYKDGLHPMSVPVLAHDRAEILTNELSPTALHLLDRIDGNIDIKSILWVVPVRPVQVLWALRNLQERGLIAISPPPQQEATEETRPTVAEVR